MVDCASCELMMWVRAREWLWHSARVMTGNVICVHSKCVYLLILVF